VFYSSVGFRCWCRIRRPVVRVRVRIFVRIRYIYIYVCVFRRQRRPVVRVHIYVCVYGIYHKRICVLCCQRRPLVRVRVHTSAQALRIYLCVSYPSSHVCLSACLSV
jgi:hypothetical protein